MAFVAGLAEDGRRFDLDLLGGDTVSTPGPLTVSATFFGWTPAGGAVKRSGARAGDALVLCGTIGDAALGLRVARGVLDDADGYFLERLRLPEPLLGLREPLRRYAAAAADVSDGLLADALHIADASGCGVVVDLGRAPLSTPAAAWLRAQPDRPAALLELATFGDDYALVCAARDGQRLAEAANAAGVRTAVVGEFVGGAGLSLVVDGRPAVAPARLGWRHA